MDYRQNAKLFEQVYEEQHFVTEQVAFFLRVCPALRRSCVLAGSFDSLFEHLDGLFEAARARLILFGFGDPAAVLFAMGEAEGLEKGEQALFLHQLKEGLGDFEDALGFVFPDSDVDGIAGGLPELFANGFGHVEGVLRESIFDERASVGNAVEGSVDGHSAFGSEFLLGVVGEEYSGSATITGDDLCLEFVFLHSATILSLRGVRFQPLSATPQSWVARETRASVRHLTPRLGFSRRLLV